MADAVKAVATGADSADPDLRGKKNEVAPEVAPEVSAPVPDKTASRVGVISNATGITYSGKVIRFFDDSDDADVNVDGQHWGRIPFNKADAPAYWINL
ncbi:MAG: hypothetical protein ACKVW3_01690 [Phycisphaerales bacterium]